MRPLGITLSAYFQFVRAALLTILALAIKFVGSMASRLVALAAEGSSIQRFLSGSRYLFFWSYCVCADHRDPGSWAAAPAELGAHVDDPIFWPRVRDASAAILPFSSVLFLIWRAEPSRARVSATTPNAFLFRA